MWRLIYKSILISIISSVLMIGDMAAYADSRGTPTKNSDGTVSRTNTYDMKDVKGDDDIVSLPMLTMVVVGALGAKLLFYEKWTNDMMVAAAASGIYVVGEIMNAIQVKEDMEKIKVSATFKSDGAIDSTQVEYIKKLRESYEKLKGYLEKKKTLQNTAMYGFLAAFAVASFQYFTLGGQFDSCISAMATAESSMPGTCASEVATETAVICKACLANIKAFHGVLATMDPVKVITAPSLVQASTEKGKEATAASTNTTLSATCSGSPSGKSFALSVTSACQAYLANKKLNSSYGSVAKLLVNNSNNNQIDILNNSLPSLLPPPKNLVAKKDMNNMKKWMSNIFSLIVPTAKAGWMNLIGLGVGAAIGITNSLGNYVDEYLFTPGGRILIWLGFAAITKIAIGATEDKIAAVEENIDKIDKILSETSKLSKGLKASNAIVRTVNLSNLQIENQDQVISNTDKTGCIGGSKDGNSCNSLVGMMGTNVNMTGLPTGIGELVTNVAKVGDGISGTGTISGTTLTQANMINSKANAIGKLVKQQQSTINDFLKKQGKGIINFDDETKKIQNGLLKATSNGLGSSGKSASAMLASMGISAPVSGANAKAALGESLAIKKSKNTSGTAQVSASPAKNETMDLNFKEDKAAQDQSAMLANGMREGTANDQYDIKQNDISKDSGVSIFEIISTRYLKSGYPKLLEEIK